MATTIEHNTPEQVSATIAAPYERVSTSEQAEKHVSLDAQKATLKAFATFQNFQTLPDYTDAGYGGGTDDRPALQRLMRDARSGRFQVIIVSKLDRFFRNLKHLTNYIYELSGLGVRFIAVAENIDTATPTGKFAMYLFGIIAEFERERISERVKDARRQRVSDGKWSSGRTPFGLRYSRKTKELELFDPEARVVVLLFQRYTTENVGLLKMAEWANQEHLVTPRMGRRKDPTWTKSTVQAILKHPGYIGGPNDHWAFHSPQIIDEDIWNEAQRRMVAHRRVQPQRQVSLFQGRFKCGLCGRTLAVAYSHGKQGRRVWSCPGRLKAEHLNGSPRCALPRMDAEALEKRVNEQVETVFSSHALFLAHVQQTLRNLEAERVQLEARIQPLETDANTLKEDMAILNVRLEMRQISPDDYRKRIRECEARLQRVQQQETEADWLALYELDINSYTTAFYRAFAAELTSVDSDRMQTPVPTETIQRAARRVRSMLSNVKLLSDKLTDDAALDLAAERVGGNWAWRSKYLPFLTGIVYPDRVEVKARVEVGNRPDTRGCKSGQSIPFLPLAFSVPVPAAEGRKWPSRVLVGGRR